jgi:carboxymethylenebutenolidase
VVIHDAFGIGQDVRNQADWLAAEGYLAVGRPVLLGRRMTCLRTVLADLRRRTDRHPGNAAQPVGDDPCELRAGNCC